MRDKVKRFISILMTALMLVNLLPVGALADGITSIGYKPETVANGNQTVYLYVKVTGNLNGLNLNKSGWCTVGKVTGLNMTDPQSYAWWYGSSNHVSSVSGISASSVGKGDVERYEKNQSIDLSKVTWASGTHYGFLPVSTGADDYVGSGWTWHLDGYIDIAQVQASYKIRYVDQDTNNVLKIAASGTDDPGVWIDHSAPKKLDGGYEIVGDTDRTFKLEQIDNTFDIYYRRQYGYKVEYYYDDVKDDKKTETGSAWCKDVIEEYIDKTPDGYEHEKTENLPLTIGTDESKNVIKVYYKKIGYTVTYEPGDYGAFEAEDHTYIRHYNDPTPAYDEENPTAIPDGKPGWTFAGWEPKVDKTVTKNAEYVAQWKEKEVAVTYEAEYGGKTESLPTSPQKITAFSAENLKAVPAPNKSREGYAFIGWFKGDDPNPLEMKVELSKETAEANLNKDDNALYTATTFTAKYAPMTSEVKYIVEKDGVQDETPISIQTISVIDGEPLENVTANPIEGYTFDGWYLHTDRIAEGSTLEAATAKGKLHRVNDLYADTTFTAKFVPDKTKTATVLCTIDEKQIGYGTVYPSIYQTILQATGKLDGGGSVSGSTATAKTGYKFAGWYKATGEATYEKVTDDPKLTSELAESTLNRDKETGLYQNTVFKAWFEPDAGAKVPVTYEAENGTLEGTTSQEAQVVTGEGLTDVEATPNKGYKFDGWYAVDKNGDKHLISGLDPAEKLDAKTAKENLNKDGNLYAATTFIARFVPDENQTVPVIYTTDENGILWGGPVIGSITYNVNIATGKVWLNNAFVDKLEPVPTYPKEGYEFDRWIRVSPETTIEGAGSTLTDEKARPNLNQKDGLYQKTEFKAIFRPQTNLSYTVNYYWNGTEIPVKPSKTVLHQTFGEEVTESPIGADDYTPLSNEPKKIKIGADSTQNVITFYYYRNVKLTANSDTKTYNGKNQSVSGYTCAVAEMKNGRLEYVPWTGEKPLIFDGISASGSGKDVNEKGYQVTFNESPIGEHDDLYYVKESQTGILMITPAPVTLQAPIASKTYDGTPLKAEDYGHSFVEGLDFADDFASISVEGSQTMVGRSASRVTYELKQGKIPNNYNIQCIPGTLTITPVMDEVLVKIKGNTANVTYDGKLHSVEGYAVDSISNSLYKDSDFTYNGVAKAEGTDAGEYKMGLTAEKFTNISDNFSSVRFEVVTDGSLTIDKRHVNLSSGTVSKRYDGTPLTSDMVTIDGDGFIEEEAWDVEAIGSVTNVSEGEVTNTITYKTSDKFNADNYNIQKTEGTLKITPRKVTLTSETASKPYDGTALTKPDVKIEGSFVEGEVTDIKATGSVTNVSEGDVTNTISYTEGEKFKASNYKIEKDEGKLSITPVTDKVTVTIKGGKSSVTYNGEDHTVSGYKVADISNPLYKEANFTFSGTAEANGKNAGTYKMGLKAADFANTSNNFKNVEFVVADGQLEITKRPVKLTSADLTKVYDGTPLTNGDTPVKEEFGTEDAFPEGEGVTYTFKGSQTNAGSSKNTFTYAWNEGTNKDNYTIYQVDGDLVVTPIDGIKVTITGHKDTQTYDGKEHSVFGYDVTVSNALYNPKEDMQFNGTDVDMTAKGTDAGTYPMKLTAEDFTNKSDNFTNVTFVVTDGYVKINPRAVTLTSETASKTYDGTALEKPVVTVGGDGFVEDQVKEIKATGSVTNAGSVANTITFTPDKETFKESNYAITKNEGTLTIAKRSVLLTSQSATKTYDGSALTRPAVTITGDGFVPGELAKVEATGSITNVGSTPNAIQYTTTGAFNPANYSIALSVGTLTVTAKPEPEPRRTFNLTVNYVYQNGKRAAASYNRGGLKNGETFDITSPVIAGYTASETVVSGTIDNRDIKVTVIYTADGVNLDDYGVPLGLGNITMNVGDCFE